MGGQDQDVRVVAADRWQAGTWRAYQGGRGGGSRLFDVKAGVGEGLPGGGNLVLIHREQSAARGMHGGEHLGAACRTPDRDRGGDRLPAQDRLWSVQVVLEGVIERRAESRLDGDEVRHSLDEAGG